MNPADAQRTVQQAWTEQRWDDWTRTSAPDYSFHLTPTIPLALDQTLEWSRAWFHAFPDYREETRAVFVGPAAVAYELSGSGTSHNALKISGATWIPHVPNVPFQIAYAKVLELDNDGLVVRDRQYLDTQAFRQQFFTEAER